MSIDGAVVKLWLVGDDVRGFRYSCAALLTSVHLRNREREDTKTGAAVNRPFRIIYS